jgi:hypothetical protein
MFIQLPDAVRLKYLESSKLYIRILIFKPSFQRSHCISRLNAFGTDEIGYLQIQCNVLPDTAGKSEEFIRDMRNDTHKDDDVAFSICSSSGEADENQPAMMRAAISFVSNNCGFD